MDFILARSFSFEKDEVAIAIMRGGFGSHIGIVFNSAKEGAQLIHLAFHRDLRVEPFPECDSCNCWIVKKIHLPKVAAKQFIGLVRVVAKRKPSISYAPDFTSSKNSFDAKGTYKQPRNSHGLTCASFVLEIFRAAFLLIINDETWIASEENLEWERSVIALLEKTGAEKEHIDKLKSNPKGMRIRPEELGGATDFPYKDWPINYLEASEKAKAVMNCLDNLCPGNP